MVASDNHSVSPTKTNSVPTVRDVLYSVRSVPGVECRVVYVRLMVLTPPPAMHAQPGVEEKLKGGRDARGREAGWSRWLWLAADEGRRRRQDGRILLRRSYRLERSLALSARRTVHRDWVCPLAGVPLARAGKDWQGLGRPSLQDQDSKPCKARVAVPVVCYGPYQRRGWTRRYDGTSTRRA
jgi:hypothetical protein